MLDRLDQRQGFLVSAVAHLVIVTILSSVAPVPARPPEPGPPSSLPPERSRVFLPPPEVLRELVPPALVPRPRPAPTPRPEAPKDRISIGPPSSLRAAGPLVLRREDDLTAVPKGRPEAVPTPLVSAAGRESGAHEDREARDPGRRTARQLDWPSETAPRSEGSGRGDKAVPSIASSLRGLDRLLERAGPAGAVTGTGRQMGPLFFDPRGADFTGWVNHFKNEVYRNWIVPQSALLGFRGHVDFEFSVDRDGRLMELQMRGSSGTISLDRAAENALLGSRLLPLPAEYGPPRVTMRVTFFYNEDPQRS